MTFKILLLSTLILITLLVPASADTFYYRNITPQNDPLEYRVNPGDTIYLDRTYDLTYVSGVTKRFAWWKDWHNEGETCTPDIIVNISYIDTNGKINPKAVWLDPAIWRTGNWWQWDGCIEKYDYSTGQVYFVPYLRDNSLAFRIINWTRPTETPTQKITIRGAGETPVHTPVRGETTGISARGINGTTGDIREVSLATSNPEQRNTTAVPAEKPGIPLIYIAGIILALIILGVLFL